MVHLIIGAGGLLLLLIGLFAFQAWASGVDAGTVAAIVLGGVVFAAIITFFAVQLSIGLKEVFPLNE